MVNQQTSFGRTISANCGKCGGAMLNQAYFEDGKWWHSWCAPSTLRKDTLRQATADVIERARAHDGNDYLQEAITRYDAARAAMRFDD